MSVKIVPDLSPVLPGESDDFDPDQYDREQLALQEIDEATLTPFEFHDPELAFNTAFAIAEATFLYGSN
jgi:hypothetical protein